jgi:A/G-specific adenine glycosylase
MLQQTRVAAVIPYYERWMGEFPTLQALAAADQHRVLVAWEGLGYYSRARNLHRAAQTLEERFDGRIPRDPAVFQALPGVGPYTTAAVLSIAYGLDLAAVDGNVRRVLARLVALETDPRRAPQAAGLEELARLLLPPGTAATHNQAMMELGATLCSPRAPKCGDCPLQMPCRARASGDPEICPRSPPRKAPPHHDVALGIVFHQEDVFIDQRPYGGLLGGLWEFPGGKVEAAETAEQALFRELREEFGMSVEMIGALPSVNHAYTHLRVTLHPRLCRFVAMEPRVGEGQPWQWVPPGDLPQYPMPRANRRVLEELERWQGANSDRGSPED